MPHYLRSAILCLPLLWAGAATAEEAPAAPDTAPSTDTPAAPAPAPVPDAEAARASVTEALDERSQALDRRLEEMEKHIARIRATDDPQERWKLMRAQSKAWREAVYLAAPQAVTAVSRRPMAGRTGPWSAHPSMPGKPWRGAYNRPAPPSPGAGRSQPAGPGARGQAARQAMQERMAALEQRIEEQREILDEIVKYREPLEKVLNQSGVAMPRE